MKTKQIIWQHWGNWRGILMVTVELNDKTNSVVVNDPNLKIKLKPVS